MRRRFFLSGPLAALAITAAACTDQIPTLAGDDFPPGSVPVTREMIFPASEFFRLLGSFSGYGGVGAVSFLVVANDYEGLHAHAAAKLAPFPRQISYERNGSERRDSLFVYTGSRLVMRVDTAASTPGPVTLRVWAAAQDWHPPTATWEAAVDTGGVAVPWTVPGGTRGDLLGEGTFTIGSPASDSLVLTLSAEVTERLSDTASLGIVITAGEAGRRIELADLILRADVRPDSAAPDTTITVTLNTSGTRTTLYTPDQPDAPPGVIAVGGVRRARTLIELDPRKRVPACPPPDAGCATVPLTEVRINEVALLLTPIDVPNGFDALGPTPLTVRSILEPELGRAAPLGTQVADRPVDFRSRDTLVAVPLTSLAATLAQLDTLPITFALLSESPVTTAAPTFGVGFFRGDPLLRIIYTLPTRRRLP